MDQELLETQLFEELELERLNSEGLRSLIDLLETRIESLIDLTWKGEEQ